MARRNAPLAFARDLPDTLARRQPKFSNRVNVQGAINELQQEVRQASFVILLAISTSEADQFLSLVSIDFPYLHVRLDPE